MITSPGLASPSSSRAIASILCGSDFSDFTSSDSSAFSLFSRTISPCTRSISSLVRPKNVVQEQTEYGDAEQRSAVLRPQVQEQFLLGHPLSPSESSR